MSLGNNALIASKIDALTKTNNRLQRMVTQINTSAYTAESRVRLQKDRETAMKLCNELMTMLQGAPKSDLITKYSQQFKEQLQKFEKVSVDLCAKDKQLLDPVFMQEEGRVEDGGFAQQHKQMLMEKTKLLSQDEMAQIDLAQMQEREREIQQVERDVHHIHEMFADLRNLVIEQGEELDSIEANITSARDEVSGGLENLEQAEEYQRKARNRKCCLLFIMTIVLTVLILGMTKVLMN